MEKAQKNTAKKGRPKKEENKLTRSINVKVSEDGYNRIEAKAAKQGLKTTQYVRQMALNGKVNSPFTPEDYDLIRKLAGIANNLNQIAKKANASGFISVEKDAMFLIEYMKNLCYDR